ncbi:hypothetical protein QTO34_019864, partial [Cnephaeus nilssonii]
MEACLAAACGEEKNEDTADARQLGLIASQALQASTGENLFSSVLKNSPERVWPLHAQSTNVIADGGPWPKFSASLACTATSAPSLCSSGSPGIYVKSSVLFFAGLLFTDGKSHDLGPRACSPGGSATDGGFSVTMPGCGAQAHAHRPASTQVREAHTATPSLPFIGPSRAQQRPSFSGIFLCCHNAMNDLADAWKCVNNAHTKKTRHRPSSSPAVPHSHHVFLTVMMKHAYIANLKSSLDHRAGEIFVNLSNTLRKVWVKQVWSPRFDVQLKDLAEPSAPGPTLSSWRQWRRELSVCAMAAPEAFGRPGAPADSQPAGAP